MADNVTFQSGTLATPAANRIIAGDEATYSGDTAVVQLTRLVHVTGAEGAKTVSELIQLEDAAEASGVAGLVMLGVRRDTAASSSGTDGDYSTLNLDSTGKLHVNVGNTVTVAAHAVTNAGTFVTQENGAALTALQLIDNLVLAEDAVHQSGDPGIQIFGVRQDAQVDFAADGDYVPFSIDANGALRVSGSSGTTQYAEDSVAASGDSLVVVGAVRRDSASSGVGADGDYATLSVDSTGSLRVVNGGVSGIFLDDAPFTLTSDAVSVVGAIRDDSLSALSAAEGDAVPLRVSSTGALHVTGGGGGTQFAEDAAHTTADVGTLALAVRRDTAAVGSGTDGDYSTLNVNSTGRLYTSATLDAAIPAGTNNIGDVDVLSLVPGTSATSLGKAEDAAHTTADTGVYVLAVRDDSLAAHSGTDGDYESIHTTAQGAVWVSATGNTTGGHTIFRSIDLDETEEEVKASAGTVYAIWFSNLATSTRFLKLYNDTAANVTVGASTPVITLALPGNASDDVSGALAVPEGGIAFSTAITAAATTGVADNDTGAPGANEVLINIFYR